VFCEILAVIEANPPRNAASAQPKTRITRGSPFLTAQIQGERVENARHLWQKSRD
jgi:hypothetical protein